jgi:hypothetical protein
VAAQMDDLQRGLAHLDGGAVLGGLGDRHGEGLGVERVGRDGGAGGLHQLLKGHPVVLVAVRGHDAGERGVADQFQEARGLVGGVDEQPLAGRGATQQIGVVVVRPDRHLGDGQPGQLADLGLAADLDDSRVAHVRLRPWCCHHPLPSPGVAPQGGRSQNESPDSAEACRSGRMFPARCRTIE